MEFSLGFQLGSSVCVEAKLHPMVVALFLSFSSSFVSQGDDSSLQVQIKCIFYVTP
jgi:hypothetical protein